MTQHYIGVKQVEAWPQKNAKDEAGYCLKYPDGYISWSPKDVFEAAYMPMGFYKPTKDQTGPLKVNDNLITQIMVDAFIRSYDVQTMGEKTTVVRATLANGFEIVESSSCVDPANYSEEIGAGICRERIRNQVWHLLGFALQWARGGIVVSRTERCSTPTT